MKREHTLMLSSSSLSFFVCFLLFSIVVAQATPRGFAGNGIIRVNTETNRLVDEDGRERVFHGTNVVYKGPPYHPSTDVFDFQYSFVEEDAQLLKSWGINAIRLGVEWPGVEPERGSYNQTYLQIMKNITDLCAKYGIYVLIDMHQDVFSQRFCGEGVPNWASIPAKWAENDSLAFPEPVAPAFESAKNGQLPTPEECAQLDWTKLYFTFAVSSANENLYKNVDGLSDRFAAYWQVLAQTFGSSVNVLGYELMNEPWAGDVFTNPTLLVPGVADRENLQPFYANASAAIRTVDTERIIFFEGVTWDDVTTGFTSVPGGSDFNNRSAITFHYYNPPNLNAKEQLETFWKAAIKLNTGWFLSETFGGTDILDACDPYFQSWMFWEYKAYVPLTGYDSGFWFPNGTLNPTSVEMYTRTFARAIAGNGQGMNFDIETKIFEVTFLIDTSCTLPTEIYLNAALNYPNGFNVELSPSVIPATWAQVSDNEIFVYTNSSDIQDGELLSVIISPK